MGIEGGFVFAVLGVIAILCGIFAACISRFMTRRSYVRRRSIRIAVAAGLSVLLLLVLVAAMGRGYDSKDPLYILVMFLPAFLICCFIAVFVSSPAAWLASRSRESTTNANIFE